MKYFFTILFSLAILTPQLSFAGFALNPSYNWYHSDTEASQSQVELRVGYAFESGLYLGGFYDLVSQKFLDTPNDSSDYYVGLHLGYEYMGVYGLLGYVINGDQDMSSGGTKYSGAQGVQLTAGYRILIAEDIFIAPEATYRKVSFQDVEVSGLAGSVNRKDEVIMPGISVYFAF